MALTGIQIFKLLPKTNCGECGTPTCLAFAMNLAAGKAELEACPYVSEEAKVQLSEASAPPIRPLRVGYGETAVKIGGETVLFRHEKTFYNQPGLAALVTDDAAPVTLEEKCQRYMAYQYERVGLNLRPELVALKSAGGDGERFAAAAKLILDKSDLSLILMSEDPGVMKAALDAVGESNPLLYAATEANAEEMGRLAQETGCPLAVKAESVEGLLPLVEKLTEMGLRDLVLDSGARTVKESFVDSVAIRRAALLAKEKRLGFPTITFPCEMTDNLAMQTAIAAGLIAKYAGLVVLSDFEGSSIFPLLLERLNIFTDPQRPMTVTQGIYEINGPDENSPVLVTSNFSLTYFIVSGEIEGSRVPTWLLILDTEGLSVLTAWAAGKFAGDQVGVFVKKSGIAEKISHRSLVIPGYAAAILGELEEELPEWSVTIGPREAAHIPKFLKEFKVTPVEGLAAAPAKPKKKPKKAAVEVTAAEEEKAAPKKKKPKKARAAAPDNKFMKAIGENLNVINKRIGKAFKDKDPKPLQEMAEQMTEAGVDFIDINLGPARKGGEELMTWVVETVQEVTDTPLCLDTSNIEAMHAGLKACQHKAIMNSIMCRPERYTKMLPICKETGSYMIALMWGPQGLPRDEGERSELATELLMAAQAEGIPMSDIWVDPIITPVNIQQEQLMSTLAFMEMLPDIVAAVDPDSQGCLSTNGLSNLSNGVPEDLRPILNQTFLIMLQRKGMYSCIIDAFDQRIMSICRGEQPELVDLVYGVMDGKEYDLASLDKEAVDYIKTARIILGHSLYSDSWLEV